MVPSALLSLLSADTTQMTLFLAYQGLTIRSTLRNFSLVPRLVPPNFCTKVVKVRVRRSGLGPVVAASTARQATVRATIMAARQSVGSF